MPINIVGDLRAYQFNSLCRSDLVHGVLSRRGGVSPEPWDSLNVGGFIGDEDARVQENIRRVFDAFTLPVESKHDVWQVHGSSAHIADRPRGDSQPVQADILICDKPHVSLFMRFADCVPIMIFDPQVGAIALVHAGWKGVTQDAPGKAVKILNQRFGSRPQDLLVGLGPAICGECYPVGIEVVEGVSILLQDDQDDILWKEGGQFHLDLPRACRRLLEQAGVVNIEMSDICTATNLKDWYSHRAEGGKTGRFGAILALRG